MTNNISARPTSRHWSWQGLKCRRQVAIDVEYKGRVITGQRLDLLVEEEVPVELKSVKTLPEVAMAQTLSQLRASGLKRALLINFREERLIDGVHRVTLYTTVSEALFREN